MAQLRRQGSTAAWCIATRKQDMIVHAWLLARLGFVSGSGAGSGFGGGILVELGPPVCSLYNLGFWPWLWLVLRCLFAPQSAPPARPPPRNLTPSSYFHRPVEHGGCRGGRELLGRLDRQATCHTHSAPMLHLFHLFDLRTSTLAWSTPKQAAHA